MIVDIVVIVNSVHDIVPSDWANFAVIPSEQSAEKGGVAFRVDKFPVLRLSRAAISAALVFSGGTF
jgi:hypothetical protein